MAARIITIGRQSGSGGREIGQRLAERLGVPFYDRELIRLAAEQSGMSEELLAKHEEKTVNRFFYSVPSEPNKATGFGLPVVDTLFIVQSQIITELAEKGPCVILGRSADYVLRQRGDLLSVFLYAPLPARVKRIMQRHQLDEAHAKAYIRAMERRRRAYYNYFTEKQWGHMQSYRCSIDSSALGVEGTACYLEKLANAL